MSSIKDKKRLGVIIFGLGRAGQIHMKNVVANYTTELLYVIDLRVDHAKQLVSQYNQSQCQVLTPSEQATALNDERVDFVMVCTPTYLHEQIVLDSLNAGKGVFCEKPIAPTNEATKNCYGAAKRNGKPLFCSFNRRYDPSVRKLYENVSTVGQIQMIKCCARDSPLPPVEYLKISGGVFHDCLVHDVDLICWLLGSYPKQVFAASHCHSDDIRSLDDVDTVAAILKFQNGALAIIDTSRDSRYGYDQRCEVFGTKGMLLNQNQRPTNTVTEHIDGQSMGRMYDSFNDRYEQSYILALSHFCKVMRGEAEVEICEEDTLNVTTIASALEESSRTGQQIDVVYE